MNLWYLRHSYVPELKSVKVLVERSTTETVWSVRYNYPFLHSERQFYVVRTLFFDRAAKRGLVQSITVVLTQPPNVAQ